MDLQLNHFASVLNIGIGHKTGIDIVARLGDAKPEDLMWRKYLQTLSREEVLSVYKELLSIMLSLGVQNDKEAARLLDIIYGLIVGDRVLSADDFDLYGTERRKGMRGNEFIFLDYVESWYFDLPLYEFHLDNHNGLDVTSNYPLVRSWLVDRFFSIWKGSWVGTLSENEGREGYVDELSFRAFKILLTLYSPSALLYRAKRVKENYVKFEERWKIHCASDYLNNFFKGERKDIERGLRFHEPQDLKLYGVLLKKYLPLGEVPGEWKEIFRIGYIKKGGEVLLDTIL